jgi:hypothetical protein
MNYFLDCFKKVALRFVSVGLLTTAFSVFAAPPERDPTEPIAYIGHGSMFDQAARQILPTPEFISQAQAWYRRKLLAKVDAATRVQYARLANRVAKDRALSVQEQLYLDQKGIEQLLAATNIQTTDPRMPGKIRLLGSQLAWQLPKAGDGPMWRERKFEIQPNLRLLLSETKLKLPKPLKLLSTTNTGQAYIDECNLNGVPIPPPINLMDPAGITGWKSEGFIPQAKQFIVGTPAELRSYKTPSGVCLALPRYSDSSLATVDLDGVICLSTITSKACFWDNQMSSTPISGDGLGFPFPAGTLIPIGKPDLALNGAGQYQAGGKEIEYGTGGICTDCHAGENPYVIHPDALLRPALTMEDLSSILPLFAPDRFQPIVGPSWAQNTLSHALPLVPASCVGCHVQGAAGRLPHLSNELPGYCGTILSGAVEGLGMVSATMPQGNPGSKASDPAYIAFKNFCSIPPTAGPSTRGDPHLSTTNGINYDFQAAGEFVALKNSSNAFELQTRQTPVTTTFMPGPNLHTGLSSCVSLNTAAAVKLGKYRVSYQPKVTRRGASQTSGQMQLRIDGRVTVVPVTGIDLGGGNKILRSGNSGELELRAFDGSRVLLTPNFWTDQGYWYLNVEVLNSPAREGTMGQIMAGDWLPVSPTGQTFGPRPIALSDRHTLLNEKFADTWRVSDATSLFDYSNGETTATFTDSHWPPAPGSSCSVSAAPSIPRHGSPLIRPIPLERAKQLCRVIENKAIQESCAHDVTNMGDVGVVKAFQRTLARRRGSGIGRANELEPSRN